MRNKLNICMLIVLAQCFIGCSKSTDGTNSTLPVTPSNLAASSISDTQVNLLWTDNSTNETGFKIERKNVGGIYSIVGSTGLNITKLIDNGLTPNTTYYYRVFSYNNSGNSPTYSNEVSVTTNASSTTTICNQVWMTKNLDVSTYRNGDVIPEVKDQAQWASLTTGAWRYSGDNSANGTIYGKLYNWYAVTDPRGIAPAGWHIPNETELIVLVNCLGGTQIAGGKLKAVSPLWIGPNLGATNSSGFTGLPGGCTQGIGVGIYWGQGSGGHWWSTTSSTGVFSKSFYLTTDNEYMTITSHDRHNGFSVRCLKD